MVTPRHADIAAGDSVEYTAEAYDNCGNPLGDVTGNVDFRIEYGAGGTWVGNVYTAQRAGRAWLVTALHHGDCKPGRAWLWVEPAALPAAECPVCPALVTYHSNRDGNWELYRTEPITDSAQIRLTENEARDIAPARSPDGEWIVFQSDRNDNWDLYLVDINGGNERQLTFSWADDVDPVWADLCDEHLIAFQSNRSGQWDIYTLDAESGEEKRLTYHPADDTDPFWSPECKAGKVAFQTNRHGNWEIYVVDVETREKVRLTYNEADDVDPVWSPDGEWILFRSNRDGNWELYLIPAEGGDEVRLTDSAGEEKNAVWSPDSQWIAFQSDRDGNWEVYVISVDGTDERNLTRNPADDEAPTWSCEGAEIVFQTDRGRDVEVYAMSASDGSNLRRLTEVTAEPSEDMFPAWMPSEEDGSLAFPGGQVMFKLGVGALER